MRASIFTACLLGSLSLSGAAFADGLGFDQPPVGKEANTFLLRGRAIGVMPLNWGSSTSIGGGVSATKQAAPEVDISYFFTDHIAMELIAGSTRHDVKLVDTAVGHVDAGSVWVLPPTLTVQYHFMPKARFSPYVGVGMNVTWFYASHGAGPTVSKLTLSNNVGGALQLGFDYALGGHWYANFDVKQIFLRTTAEADTVLGHVSARTWLSPMVVGAGIGYRF